MDVYPIARRRLIRELVKGHHIVIPIQLKVQRAVGLCGCLGLIQVLATDYPDVDGPRARLCQQKRMHGGDVGHVENAAVVARYKAGGDGDVQADEAVANPIACPTRDRLVFVLGTRAAGRADGVRRVAACLNLIARA